MFNKLKIINEKISILENLNSAIDIMENKKQLTICVYYENYYSIWRSSEAKELIDFRNSLEEKIKQNYLEELKRKRDEITSFLNASITIEEKDANN